MADSDIARRGPGALGLASVGVRCDNGLFSTHKSPNFILASLSLLEYPDKIGL